MKHIVYSDLTKRFYHYVNGNKIDITDDIKEIVDFSHMWINTLLDSKSITHFFLEDSQNNKKIFFTQDLLSVTIMAPNMPDWNLDDRED